MERSPGPPGVEFESVTVRLGRQIVLHGVTFAADAGVTCLVGNNGSGKATVLRAAATLVPVQGEVRIAGEPTSSRLGVEAARRRFGYLSAEATGTGQHSVEEAVTYAAWLQHVPRHRRRAWVVDAIDQVGLGARRGDHLDALSTGLRRRALLAQALVHRPAVLLLDEPTAAVDPEHRTVFREILGRLGSDRTVVFSTHLSEDVEHAAHQVVALGEGQVRWTGTSEEFFVAGESCSAGRKTESRFERSLRVVAGADRVG